MVDRFVDCGDEATADSGFGGNDNDGFGDSDDGVRGGGDVCSNAGASGFGDDGADSADGRLRGGRSVASSGSAASRSYKHHVIDCSGSQRISATTKFDVRRGLKGRKKPLLLIASGNLGTKETINPTRLIAVDRSRSRRIAADLRDNEI